MVLRQIKLQISHRNYWLILCICLLNTSREIIVENFALIKFKDHFSQLIILEFEYLVAITNLVCSHSLKKILELIGWFLKSY